MAIINLGPIAIHDQGVHVSTKAYQRLARVSHPTTGARYLAYRFDVPAGIELTNTSYWRFEDMGVSLIQSQINDIASSVASMATERGSNANGDWVKLSDGTLICYWTGSIGTVPTETLFFPMAFIDTPVITTQSRYSQPLGTDDNRIYYTTGVSKLGLTNDSFIIVKNSSSLLNPTTDNFQLSYTAIGRWK